jgi:shikimate kinase
MLITLTGFMGSGKSTVGRIVADALGCPFFDLDELVEKQARKSVAQVFVDEGEAAFRALEAAALKKAVNKYAESTVVLALGGGALENPESARLIREKSLCIYLQASADTLRGRLAEDAAVRPLLAGDWEALLTSRLPVYESTAAITLDTDGLTPSEIADEIIIDCL